MGANTESQLLSHTAQELTSACWHLWGRSLFTVVRGEEGGFVDVVFDVDRLPVERRRGDYLPVGSVDGQPVRWVVQLRIPEDTQARVNAADGGQLSGVGGMGWGGGGSQIIC